MTLYDPSPLLVLAVVVVAGVISGQLARMIRLPSVTGQILAGILLGPSVLKLFETHAIHGLAPVTHFALAIIAVAVGSHLHLPRLKNARRRLLALFATEITITPTIVFFGVVFLPGVEWTLALLLAALAISTAPATVLALVKEERAEGVFVKTLIAAVALNNIACILMFEMAFTAVSVSADPEVGLGHVDGHQPHQADAEPEQGQQPGPPSTGCVAHQVQCPLQQRLTLV